MPDMPSAGESPLFWPVAKLIAAYRARELSPVEVLLEARARTDAFGGEMNIYVTRMDDLATQQARAAEAAYRCGEAAALSGVPVSVKDAFEVKGYRTTFGSLMFADHISKKDAGTVRRLRKSGAVLTGKTNTAEFGQSATTDNLLGPDTTNAWDTRRTAGGSSGGAASSVAAGLVSVGLGSDGGGSVRIPAAFSGLFGFKPTYGLVRDEGGCAAMSDFVCPGPLARSVADARLMMNVLADQIYSKNPCARPLKIACCATPEARPVDKAVLQAFHSALYQIRVLGHDLIEVDIPIGGWKDIFGPLVLSEELRERGHFLTQDRRRLTDYERASLEAAQDLRPQEITVARQKLARYRARFDAYLSEFDVILTPTTAVTAFETGNRPVEIEGSKVSELWGAFPFTSAFNVAGVPAASVPCALVNGMPVGLQVIMGRGRDGDLLNLCEDLEQVFSFDLSGLKARWELPGVKAVSGL
jgi:amidase